MRSAYYQDDLVTIYHADCRDVLSELGDVGMTLTDPPYGIGVKYGNGDQLDGGERYWDWLREVVNQCKGLSPVLVMTHRVAALKELTDWDWVAVWSKEVSTGVRLGNSPIVPHWEPILLYGIHGLGTKTSFTPDVFSVRPERTDHGGVRGRESWARGADHLEHPVPKPMLLWRALLTAFGQAGGTVLDPFVGTGTTLRAAKDAGRKAIGIEIQERYCEVAAKRCSQEVLFIEGAA